MLRVLFFVMTYVTDYRGTAEFVQAVFTQGLVNAGVVISIAGACMAMRGWQMKRGRFTNQE